LTIYCQESRTSCPERDSALPAADKKERRRARIGIKHRFMSAPINLRNFARMRKYARRNFAAEARAPADFKAGSFQKTRSRRNHDEMKIRDGLSHGFAFLRRGFGG
jgi:hypothetical protein